MKTRAIFILLFAVLWHYSALSQGWQYLSPVSGQGHSVIQTQDGHLVFLGRENIITGAATPLLRKTDVNGHLIWSKTYPSLLNVVVSGLIELPNGQLLVVGDRSISSGSDSDIFMMFTDALGNLVNVNYFDGAGYEYGNDIIQDADGNVYVLGATDGSGNGLLDAFVLKFNANGDLLWQKTYGYSGYDMATTAEPLPGGELLVFGWSQDMPGGQDRLYLIHLDANGNEVGSQLMYDTRFGDICPTADGNFFIATQEISAFNQRDLKVAKISPALTELWSQSYAYDGYDMPNDIAATSDGGFIIAGRNDDPSAKLVLLKGNAAGALEWRKRYGSGQLDIGEKIIQLNDGAYAFAGQGNLSFSRMFAGKVDQQGNMFSHWVNGRILLDGNDDCQEDATPTGVPWKVTLDSPGNDFTVYADANGYFSIQADTGVYQVSVQPGGNPVFYQQCMPVPALTLTGFYDTTTIGNILFKHVPPPTETISGYVFYDANGNCVFDAGETPIPCATVPVSPEGQFDVLYSGISDSSGYFEILVPINEHYFPGQFWWNSFWNCNLGDCSYGGGYVTVGQSFTLNVPLTCTPDVSIVAGRVFLDADNNCLWDQQEQALYNWQLAAVNTASSDTVFVNTLPDGMYNFLLGTGTYHIFVQLPNGTWQTCVNPLQVNLNGESCHTDNDFPIQAAASCPLLEIDLSTLGLRPCFMNTYHVSYCNLGSETATNAFATVVLDSMLQFVSASIPGSQNGQLISFDLGDVAPLACGTFTIQSFLDCDAAIGTTHCVEAHIYPDTTCVPTNPLWDGSSIQISGKCAGDSIVFTLSNVGAGDMSQMSEYIVIEDNVLILSRPFILPAGQDTMLVFHPDGATMRLEALQTPFHPGNNTMPGISLEGCGTNEEGGISLGFVTQYPENDAEPAISIECQESVGSYDPNDKRGFPKGATDGHFIRATDDLEYQIRFQNTGTAPAFTVVVRDTLSEFLNAATLRPGAASHSYSFSLENERIAIFTFENINLPDLSEGFEASTGFIKFRVSQTTNNQPGTQIHNSAAIYFDNNAPVITNHTEHNIPYPVQSRLSEQNICMGNSWMGLELIGDTLITEVVHYGLFDSLLLYDLAVIPPDFTIIDTQLIAGQIYQGIAIQTDTTIVSIFTNEFGCDSTVVAHISVLPDGVWEQQINGLSSRVFPNPASGMIFIEMLLTTGMDVEIHLANLLQQAIKIPQQQRYYSTGNHRLPIDVGSLPAGCYLVTVQSGSERYVHRLILK